MRAAFQAVVITAIAFALSGCTPAGQGFVAGGLQYQSDLRVCRSATRVLGGDVEWDDRSEFSAAREEAGRRSLDLNECRKMLRANGEIGRRAQRSDRGKKIPGVAERSSLKLYIYGKWDGISDDIAGYLITDSAKNGGNLEVRVEQIDLSCSGRWKWLKGAYDSNLLPQGIWSINCGDERNASGTYFSYRSNEGLAEGRDSQGNWISFYFRDKAGSPPPTITLP